MEVPSHVMHDIDYVIELAEAYGRAQITRDELQDESIAAHWRSQWKVNR